jgi:hypothetical protein
MVQPDEQEPERPSFAGAAGYHPETPGQDTGADDTPERPGYQRVPEGMGAHAPMPGSPPYPATPHPAVSPTSPRTPSDPTTLPRALAAAAVWFAVNVLVTLVLYGPVGTITGLATLVAYTLLVGLGLWLLLRHRGLPFWQLVLIAAPLYWIVRLVAFPRVM